jgi:gentisate 1,2-dioxygenase
MLKEPLPQSIADLPAQRASAPRSKAESRARYFNSGNAFNLRLPPVPGESFTAEPMRALHRDTPTGLIACDRSKQLGCAFPATTPLVLARYARICAGEALETRFAASGVIGYVIAGSGSTDCGAERIEWKAGDTFVLPGGSVHVHRSGAADAVLWIVTNEPQLAFENLSPPKPGEAPTDVVHFPGDEVARQIELLYQVGGSEDIAGMALIFSSVRQEAFRNVLPTLTLAMNSLPGGESQRAHRHNSVAVSLVVQGENCHSIVDGQRKDWSQWATTVTPPTSVHSHHNGGNKTALFLIVQDGGIYYHARAVGFEFADG